MLVRTDSVPLSGLPCHSQGINNFGSLYHLLGSTNETFPVLLLFVVNFALWILFCSLPTHLDLVLCICLDSQIHLPLGADLNAVKPWRGSVS